MLSRDALQSALPLTDVLDNARLFVTPVPGTPLEALVRETRADDGCVAPSNIGNYNPDLGTIEYLANCKDPVLGVCKHDMVMDEVSEISIQSVQGAIMFARTSVAPVVQELVEKVTTVMNEQTPSVLLGMEVSVWNPPKPLSNASLENSVRRFEDVGLDSPNLILKMPTRTAKEIIELMQSGAGGLDGDIQAWAAEKGDLFFVELWENVFQQKQADLNASTTKRFIDYISDRVNGLDYATGIYLLSRRLVDDPIDGIEMSLPVFERTIVEFRNQAGARLARAIDEQDSIDKSGLLVREVKDRTTVVNGSVYRKWIEEGGENEVLFGNLLIAPILYTVEAINGNAAELKNAWTRHATLTATVESNRRFGRMKDALARIFRQQLFAVTEGEEATEANRQIVLRLFDEQLDTVRESDSKDLFDLCLRLVCRSRFFRTDAERILSGMEHAKRENPSLDIREAAAVSVLEYVAEWVASQLKVEAVAAA